MPPAQQKDIGAGSKTAGSHIRRWLGVHSFDPALSFKATIARSISSGTAGDSDVFGAQQHAPLLDVEIPWDG